MYGTHNLWGETYLPLEACSSKPLPAVRESLHDSQRFGKLHTFDWVVFWKQKYQIYYF